MEKIAAIIVTYNRLNLLRECINSLRNQSKKVDQIFVINNSSTDGTLDWLTNQYDIITITQENTGSSGGQYTGIKMAFEKGYDWIWCLDTDIVLEPEALANLIHTDEATSNKVGFLTSAIFFEEGILANLNLPELVSSKLLLNHIINSDKTIPIMTASFGSLLIPKNVIEKVGYPSKDFFIWGDDAEFTLRITSAGFNGYLVKNSIAKHYCGLNLDDSFSILRHNDFKFRYGIRNLVYVIMKRNVFVYNSRLRGFVSSIAFIFRIIRGNTTIKGDRIQKLIFQVKSLNYLIKGLFFRPRIETPSNN